MAISRFMAEGDDGIGPLAQNSYFNTLLAVKGLSKAKSELK